MKIINKFKSDTCLVRGQALRLRSGQAMVEAMVAMSIIVVGLLGAFALSSSSIGLNRTAADRYIAVNLANEGIELVKNLIDSNDWNGIPGLVLGNENYEIDYNDAALEDVGGNPLCFNKISGYYRYCELEEDMPTNYQRKITITYPTASNEQIKVVSEVTWKAKDGSELNFSVEDHFYYLKGTIFKP